MPLTNRLCFEFLTAAMQKDPPVTPPWGSWFKNALLAACACARARADFITCGETDVISKFTVVTSVGVCCCFSDPFGSGRALISCHMINELLPGWYYQESPQIWEIIKISIFHIPWRSVAAHQGEDITLTVLSTASSAESSFPFLSRFQTYPALISGRGGPAAICIDTERAHVL